jgi:hypothetical protein
MHVSVSCFIVCADFRCFGRISGGATRGSRGGGRPGSPAAMQASPVRPWRCFHRQESGPARGRVGDRRRVRPSRDPGAKRPLPAIEDEFNRNAAAAAPLIGCTDPGRSSCVVQEDE